ncbi:MAG: TonB-dependent receptor [Bacteroidales bacterium]|nr:TonB-dependent receptor [Bacteroidales bacterium]MBN2763213.1 TonB-dependent receptor [Bacteroidales bacterium]
MKDKRKPGKIVFMMLFCFLQIVAFSQEKTITGTVTTVTGEELPGASIVVKGTLTGTTTDVFGNYTLTVPDENAVLVFSFIGYISKEQSIAGMTTINMILEEDLMKLEEVVVVGYGVSKKSDLTGAVSSVKEEDFNQISAATPEQLIQGRVPGVQITQNNGEPGAAAQIRIRGASTIRSSQQPLYVIDGVPLDMQTSSPGGPSANGMGGAPATNPLNFLNSNDIEAIDILKDASATAIYGSRGANGVILITTKKGKEGKTNLEYSTYLSISKLPKKLDVLSAEEWLKVRTDTLDYAIDNENHYGNQTDWQDQIFRTALSHSHNIAMSGGTERNSYRVSFNYLDQEGIIEKSSLDKYVGRVNLTQKALKDRLSLEVNLTASQTKENRVPVGATGFEGDLLLNALKTNPTWPVYDSAGAPFQTISTEERNPIAMLEYTRDITRTTRILGGASATLEIFKGLNYKLNLGVDYTNAIRKISQSQELSYLSSEQGRAQINTNELQNFIIEHTLNYNKSFGIHGLGVMAGFSYQKLNRNGYNQQAGFFTTDKIDYVYQMDEGDPDYTMLDSWANTPEELQSFFGRINYNLNEKYLITATLRRDGSSKFGTDSKYGNFPSLAFAWRLSQEDFIQNLNVFSNLKLRLGWGKTGNSEIGTDNSTFLLAPDAGSTAIINHVPVTGFKIDKTPQPGLHWETTTSTNIGLDFGFLDGKLSGTVDLFRKKTTDMLVEQPTQALSPTSNFISNLEEGYVLNDGIELGIDAYVINASNFTWSVNFNFTAIKNRAEDILDDDASIIPTGEVDGQGMTGAYAQAYANGKPMASFYMIKVDSVGQVGRNKGRVFYIRNSAGTADSFFFIGSALPKFTWGLNNSFRYKNFDLSFFIDAVYGNKVFNNTALLLDKTNLRQAKNALQDFVADDFSYTFSSRVSDRYLEDASYIRLSSATLGYNFKLGKIDWIQNLRLYASGSNLFIITNYSGYDPDVSSSADMNGVRALGIDITNYPKARTFLFGLNVTF